MNYMKAENNLNQPTGSIHTGTLCNYFEIPELVLCMYHHPNAEKSALQFVERLFVVVTFSMPLDSLTCLQNIFYHVVLLSLLSLNAKEIYLHS